MVLLDLSATFESVDHDTLLRRLHISYGIDGSVIEWFTSYLTGRSQYVHMSSTDSAQSPVLHGVPQGSVLGPVLFTLYTADLLQLIEQHNLNPHAYADDNQIYGSCLPSSVDTLMERVSNCVDDVSSWMIANRLQLNHSKTEVIWFASSRRQHMIPNVPIRIGSSFVTPVSSVRNLGVHLDTTLSMETHITSTVSACFAALRRIRSVKHALPQHALLTVTRALVVSKADYCNSILTGTSKTLLNRLQSVLNAAARLISSTRKYDHITPILCDLHWLRIEERIEFRLCVIAYRSLHNTAPVYFSQSLHRSNENEARRRLRSSAAQSLIVPYHRCVTLGDRAFSVAAAKAFNSLPPSVRAAPSLENFRCEMKTVLFKMSFPDC